jgi:hypothetical protein
VSELPLEPTSFPGVYRRGSRFVAVYRRAGRLRKETAGTFAEAQMTALVQRLDTDWLRRLSLEAMAS